jgi:hypothetical protein
MKTTFLTLLLVLSLLVCQAQDIKPGPQPPPETGENFKVGVAGYTFVKFGLDKTLETLKALDVHYLCIKDFHLPMTSSDAEIAAFHEKLKANDVIGYAVGPIYMRSEEEVDKAARQEAKQFIKFLRKAPDRPFNFTAMPSTYADTLNKFVAINDYDGARWYAERYLA